MPTKISLCMIVRNEAGNLRRCLASVIGAVDEIIIVDTGSTDDTCQIAREFGAQVRSFPWNENFSDARNASLEPATSDWILFLDADEELAGDSKKALRRVTADETVEGYFIKIINYLGNEGWTETCPDMVFRLFRNRQEYRFRGHIHEQVMDVILEKNNGAAFQMAEDVVIYHYGYLDKQIDEKDKKARNLKIIQKEMEQNPDNRLLRFHYGVELFRAERFAEAAEEFRLVAGSIDPNTIFFPKLLRYLVMSYQSAGQSEKSLEAARLGLQFFPNYADLYYYAGLNYLELKQYAGAAEAFEKATAMPEQPAQYASFNGVRGFRSYYHLGQIAEIFLNYEEALKNYISCLRDNPFFQPALQAIVKILKPRENPAYTKECLEKVFDFCTPQANKFMGEIYFREGAYSLCLEYLEKSIKGGLTSPEMQLWQAICLSQEQRYLEALRILDSFPRDSSLYPLGKLNKLLCFWLQGQKKKVTTLLMELRNIGLSGDTDRVLTLLLDSLNKRKKLSGVFLSPDGVALLLDIIKRVLTSGETDRAVSLLNIVSPGSLEEQRLTIAQIFYDYGCYEQAKTFIEEYLAAVKDMEGHILMAEISRAEGNFTDAEQHYRYALEINPDEPGNYVRLINLYESKRREILAEAKEKYPDIEIFIKLSEEA